MTAAPTRSVRAIVAGLAALTVVAVGCTADPATDEDRGASTTAPATDGTDAPDETAHADGEGDDATGGARTSAPDTPAASTGPAAKPSTGAAAKPAAQPAVRPATKPPAEPATIADGHHTGRLVSITTADITVALVRILTGEEAIAAAKADGGAGLDDDGTLPNDIYIQDLDRAVTIPVAGDGGFRVYDCSGGCELVGTTLAALASGEAVPYGGPNAVVDLTVDRGVVVSFQEQYLP
jgi:hypothetical protein